QNAYKMLSIRVWKEFSEAMSSIENKELSDKYSSFVKEKMSALQKNPEWVKDFGLHAGADAVTTGLLTDNEIKVIYDNSFNDKINRISYSPFNQFFIIQAFAKMKKYDDALSSIRDLWGGQIKYGGTTFFEDYRPSWNQAVEKNAAIPNNQCGFTSLTHPWGSGVTKWLTEEVLGIKPTSPGFKTVDILPNLGRKLTHVSGNVYTPLGTVEASFNVFTGVASVSIPQGAVGRIGIPKVEKSIKQIKVNGNIVWNSKYVKVLGIAAANADDDFIYLTGVKPGKYEIKISYTGKTPDYVELKEQYQVSKIKTDSVTHGNWGSVYGKDGYVLCNYSGDGKDKSAIPSYVASIDYYKVKGNGKPLNVIWDSTTTDSRALAPDANNSFPRTAACYYA
ncbi:MAG: hypothetical protein EOO85_30970, partial [Pedobacter sp.]